MCSNNGENMQEDTRRDSIVSPIKSAGLLSDQVYAYLKELFDTDQFTAGQKLPSETKLAEGLNVSRISLREALQRLELEGYIERKRGVGTFVIDRHPSHAEAGIEKLISISEVLRSRGHVPGTKEIEIFSEPASEDLARALRLDVGAPLTVVNRIRTSDGKPLIWDSSRFPAVYLSPTTLPEQIGGSLFGFVENKLGLSVSHAVSRLLPARASADFAQKMDIEEGTLMIKLEQVHYLRDDTPVWQSTLHFPESDFSWYIVRTR